jgi:hypothetical protein
MLERTGNENPVAMAARHVAEGRRIVAQQRARIARLRARGHPVGDHQQVLSAFEETLRHLEWHEKMLRKEANGHSRQSHRLAGFQKPVAR